MTRRWSARGRAAAVLLAAVLVLGSVSIAPAYGVDGTCTMQFVESPSSALNDHTGFGVRFGATASGIPDGQYYVKLLIADTNSSGTFDVNAHRGFTWNPVTQMWIAPGAAWSSFPTVSSTSGAIPKGWLYAKFGDESVNGTRYLHVVLCSVADGTLYYPSIVKQVEVLDAATEGAWLHNATTPADPAGVSGKRLAVFATDASTTNGDPNYPPTSPTATLYSLWEMQANLIDDDGNGLIDAADANENYGPQDTNLADYRVGIFSGTNVDVYANRVLIADDYIGASADCDMAVGSADTAAPAAVTGLAASITGDSVELAWTASTDADAAAYRVYRWEVPQAAGLPYTPAPVCIDTVAVGTTAYSDTAAVPGTQYAYQVRVTDNATNVGPRSATVTATAGEYVAQFIESPLWALNDHTGFGVRFGTTASLLPDGQYYVKLLVTDSDDFTALDPDMHRGFTWNAATHEWVQEGSAWSDFPTVTSTAGVIAKSWVWAKYGDENSSGWQYVYVALCSVADGTVYYPSTVNSIHVLDAATEGAWIHNSATMSSSIAGKRLAVLGSGASTGNGDPNYPPTAPTATLLSLWELQANLIDDDGNGLIDAADVNENYGPQDTNVADYRAGVAASTAVDLYLNRVLNSDNYTTGAADCDMAVGAADTVAPAAVDDLDVTTTMTSADLAWGAVADADVSAYRIYRWETPVVVGLPYTPAPVCIDTVAGTETSYADTDFAYDVEYAYEVRAVDTATNVGPRSNTATAIVDTPANPVYRFFNFTNNTHFFTDSLDEANHVIATWPNVFRYEGIAYYTNPLNNAQPLYRFYNNVSKSHFYTASLDEANYVIANYGNVFTYDGQTYAVNPAPVPGSVPVYRFFNLRNGSHFYTASAEEADMVIATWPTVYRYEGPAFWIGQ